MNTTHKPHILCLDDDPFTLELLGFVLGRNGYEVLTAVTVAQALELIRSNCFHLYIFDHILSDGTGIELCRRIRETDKTTPIIIHTGAAREIDIKAGIAAGADDYLIKPNGWDKLTETVERLVGNSALA